MNAEIKQKWIEALKSGKYRQGREALRDSDNDYCCLGVLCDLVDPNGWSAGALDDVFIHGTDDAWPGLSVLGPANLGLRDAEKLAEMNDSGSSFAEIADHIEANL